MYGTRCGSSGRSPQPCCPRRVSSWLQLYINSPDMIHSAHKHCTSALLESTCDFTHDRRYQSGVVTITALLILLSVTIAAVTESKVSTCHKNSPTKQAYDTEHINKFVLYSGTHQFQKTFLTTCDENGVASRFCRIFRIVSNARDHP